MKPIKIERVLHYEGGLERRSSVVCDESGNPVKPEMSVAASDEWDSVTTWFQNKGLEHMLDGSTLRDHCIAVSDGIRSPANWRS